MVTPSLDYRVGADPGQVCLFVGGPFDGERLVVDVRKNTILMREEVSWENGVDQTFVHKYHGHFLGEGVVRWRVYVHETGNGVDLLETLLGNYGKEFKPKSEFFVPRTEMEKWDHSRTEKYAPGTPPYKLMLWNPVTQKDQVHLESTDFTGLLVECDKLIKKDWDCWILDAKAEAVGGIRCSVCDSRDWISIVTPNGGKPTYLCRLHWPNPSVFLGSSVYLHDLVLANWRRRDNNDDDE